MPVGGGLAMIEALRDHAVKQGVTFMYETTALQFTRDNGDGKLRVLVANKTGITSNLQARAVIVASGGFEGNPEMLTQYLGHTAKFVRPVARGGNYNKGEGIRMALGAGAAPAGDFNSYHAEPLDPRSTQPEALVMNFPYGILVNKLGKRFCDEAPGPVDIHYDHIARDISSQPDGIAYVIYDSRIDDVPNWKRSIRTDQPPLKAASIEELAHQCGINPDALNDTVQQYNRACPNSLFKPLEVDNLATQGVEPVKSNWSRSLNQAPFYAYPIISGVCFTYGGIKTNRSAQVIDSDGRVIPGLYAVGEAAGLYYQVYTGATSVLRGAVFGRIAGAHAAGLKQ
jgi:tricarballylate dehydrogenase